MSAVQNFLGLLTNGPRVLRAMVWFTFRGVRFGPAPWIRGPLPRVVTHGTVRVGRRFRCDGLQTQVDFGAVRGATLTMGDFVRLNRGVEILASREIVIGDYCRIGEYSAIYDTNFHAVEEGAEVHTAPVRLGTNVWIGRNVTILAGVEIGDHSVIGAGSVVTGSIPARCVAAGVPAKVRREITASDGWRRH